MLLFLSDCGNNTELLDQLKAAEKALAATQAELRMLKMTTADDKGKIVHFVYFKLKPEVEVAAIVEEIKKLKTIGSLDDFEVGTFKDLNDPRALSEYDVLVQMQFENEEAYRSYQAHPVHNALKENTKEMLAGPPSTFDYTVQ